MTTATTTKKFVSFDMRKDWDPRIRAAAIDADYGRLLTLRRELGYVQERARHERLIALEGIGRRLERVNVLIAQIDLIEVEAQYEKWLARAQEIATTRGMRLSRKTDLLKRAVNRVHHYDERMNDLIDQVGAQSISGDRWLDLRIELSHLEDARERKRRRNAEDSARHARNKAEKAEKNRRAAQEKGAGSKKK